MDKMSGVKLSLAAHYAKAVRFICTLQCYARNKQFGVEFDSVFNTTCGYLDDGGSVRFRPSSEFAFLAVCSFCCGSRLAKCLDRTA